MKIMKKIKAHRDLMSAPNGAAEADRLQKESVDAVIKGMGSSEWEKYMKNFHSNSAQLQRLLGDDQAFMNSDWGRTILAYVVSAGNCGGGTTLGLVMNMPDAMKGHLDNGISPNTAPGESLPIPLELESFI